ncbi:hypothetical protein CJ030_MR0G007651 [Morella rubra]|uniref:PRC-barrel domain-containing protein n=1 Tax=Morella rubra TaxID=262757 RepID=A0A6A1UJ98_9ROSI|nr:hypothetical protein CJ030_MR0G007646 [Morella rubra]KAB1200321.1 hypothetical protein CJ030_MR0G007651 [Morella rubra]
MCDCLPSSSLPFAATKYRKFGLTKSSWSPKNERIPNIQTRKTPSLTISHCINTGKAVGPEEYEPYGELGFKEKGESISGGGETASSGLDFLELKGSKRNTGNQESVVERELVEVGGQLNGRVGQKKGRQMVRRSNMVAKQVISIRTALSLGFVSELWVDTTAVSDNGTYNIVNWVVLFVEVRPNLLSGESESLLLEDVSQVGDVVLVEDESFMENDFKMVGLETLVGYKVVTPGRRNIGKVRGYSFNINSGAVESLELDSFGISLIPSSLVSTYALYVEDVLEVIPDAVVVHEAAASRIQRLTKGFLGSQTVRTSIDDPREHQDFERPSRSEYNQSKRRSSSDRRFQPRNMENEDDWELPMDFS